jgi:threonine dehydrogenase-like Zn-dependent dehydrogenase
MRAAVLSRGQMVVRDDVAEPVPAAGQVLVAVKACGICGSDLHFARHGHKALEVGRQIEGMPTLGEPAPEVDLGRDVFMGRTPRRSRPARW